MAIARLFFLFSFQYALTGLIFVFVKRRDKYLNGKQHSRIDAFTLSSLTFSSFCFKTDRRFVYGEALDAKIWRLLW